MLLPGDKVCPTVCRSILSAVRWGGQCHHSKDPAAQTIFTWAGKVTSLQGRVVPYATRRNHELLIGSSSPYMCESHKHNWTFPSLKPCKFTLYNENQKGGKGVNVDPVCQNWMNNLFCEFCSPFVLQIACKQFTLFFHLILFKIICWIISTLNSWSAYHSWAVG